MTTKRLYVLLFVGSLVATMALLWTTASDRPGDAIPGKGTLAALGKAGSDIVGEIERRRRPSSPGRPPTEADAVDPERLRELENRFVLMLRHLYGDSISDASVQVMLANFRSQVFAMFPNDGEQRFRDILKKAFPGYAGQILETLGKVDDYNRWLAENEDMLGDLSPEEQEQAVRDKQREVFGEEAAAELAQAEEAREARQQAMQETMEVLGESTDTSIDDKLDVYRDALEENYSGGPEAWTLENAGLLAQTFVGLESVQQELAGMDPQARQRKLNEIRRELGFNEEQIAAQQQQDEARNRRWEQGLAYMDEREKLARLYSGEDLERELASLREEFFAHEARTIELEERDGFFRYERPRVHGRN